MITDTGVEAFDSCRLRLRFSDGTVGEVQIDVEGRGPMFEPLRDPGFFQQVAVDEDSGTGV